MVANSTFIQVQKSEDPEKCIAHVKSISHDCDLALLQVENLDFLINTTAPSIGKLPSLRDRVSVIGFPIGGDEVSITEGVVSRVEVQRYSHSQRELLAVTVDAAINHGNSGGPVFKDGKIVGIAFQKLDEADGIGEMVPASIIKNFLKLAPHHARVTIPNFGISTQSLENKALRKKFQLDTKTTGVLCLTIDHLGTCWNQIKKNDVITNVDDYSVANNGTIHFRKQYRARFDVILGEKYVGDNIDVHIIRDGTPQIIELTLKAKNYLIRDNQYETIPRYYIFGGLVFQPLSRDYLETWNNWTSKAPDEFFKPILVWFSN